MPLSRAEFLRLAGLVAAGAGLASCAPLSRSVAQLVAPADPVGGHLPAAGFAGLRRLTYGPRPSERVAVANDGLASWVESQLSPENVEDPGMALRIRPFADLHQDASALATREKQDVIQKLKDLTLVRRIYSRRQLYEMMVEFWTDHFNISVHKGDCWFLKPIDDREVVRAHAMGNFRDLLGASARSPAMLVYLDNQANHHAAPNENYARELLELHTLGVEGGYTQRDVMELARCLSGRSVKAHFWPGDFTFDENRHDPHPKHVLGLRLQPTGMGETERVLDHAATHPATARHLAVKLTRRFLSDQPERDFRPLVGAAATAFRRSGGEIRALLRVILLDGVADRDERLPPKLRRPMDYVTAALRMTGAGTSGGADLSSSLARMGQPDFEWPTPDGPPDVASAWEGNLLPRWQFALALCQDELADTHLPGSLLAKSEDGSNGADLLNALSSRLLGAPVSDREIVQLSRQLDTAGASPAERVRIVIAGLLASPAFQWR